MYKIYQIEYGDTIDIIANKTGTTPQNIKDINGFTGDSDLVVGSLMIVPKKENQLFETYTVKQGDSIYSISREYNINPDTLLLLNGLKKDEYIYPNQELMIPSSDIMVYVTREGDTIDTILENFGIDADTLDSENDKIFLEEDQLIVHRK